MTLIECFTNAHIDNIAACLRLRPDKLLIIGNANEMYLPVKRYQKLLAQRGLRTKIEQCDVRGLGYFDICAVLKRIIQEESDCVIDLTGGDETVILAVGAVVSQLDPAISRRVRVEIYDRNADAVLDCIHNNRGIAQKAVDLTVAEMIALHGGVVQPGAQQMLDAYTKQDITGLWQIVCEAPKIWNQSIGLLNEFESRSDSKTQVFLPLNHLRSSIHNFQQKISIVRDLLEQLQRCGAIKDFSRGDALEYTYCSPLLRYCTKKAGNMLEVKTLLESRSLMENGMPFFTDCQTSVSIDWDGIVYDPAQRIPETRNEIDVVLMHGLTPLFVSCKNGNIGEEELYKLNTVAERFGGPYAKKMLIATDLDQKSAMANRSFAQRAWDMDIFLVTDAAELSEDEWRQIFVRAVQ